MQGRTKQSKSQTKCRTFFSSSAARSAASLAASSARSALMRPSSASSSASSSCWQVRVGDRVWVRFRVGYGLLASAQDAASGHECTQAGLIAKMLFWRFCPGLYQHCTQCAACASPVSFLPSICYWVQKPPARAPVVGASHAAGHPSGRMMQATGTAMG